MKCIILLLLPILTDLSKNEFLDVLDFLGGDSLEKHGVYPKICYDKSERNWNKKRLQTNIQYEHRNNPSRNKLYCSFGRQRSQLGNLSEKFVENLSKNDIFVLGGRTYQFIESNRSTVVVKDGLGRKPTVPSWSGEMLLALSIV